MVDSWRCEMKLEDTITVAVLGALFNTEQPALDLGGIPFVPVGMTKGEMHGKKVAVLLCSPAAFTVDRMDREDFKKAVEMLEDDSLPVVFTTVAAPNVAFPIQEKAGRFKATMEGVDEGVIVLIALLLERVNELSARLFELMKEEEGA